MNTTDKMHYLEICRDIEKLCAELYYHYSERFADIPEAAELWKKTALEEENHQKQFELAIRLFDDASFEVVQFDLEQAYTIQYKLQGMLHAIKNSNISLLTAITKAVEMEEKLANLHVYSSLKFKDEAIQKLFTALGNADHEHAEDLKRYHSILFLPFSEMTA